MTDLNKDTETKADSSVFAKEYARLHDLRINRKGGLLYSVEPTGTLQANPTDPILNNINESYGSTGCGKRVIDSYVPIEFPIPMSGKQYYAFRKELNETRAELIERDMNTAGVSFDISRLKMLYHSQSGALGEGTVTVADTEMHKAFNDWPEPKNETTVINDDKLNEIIALLDGGHWPQTFSQTAISLTAAKLAGKRYHYNGTRFTRKKGKR